MSMLKAGLIQLGLKGTCDQTPAQIRQQMIAAHVPHIEQPAAAVANGYFVGAVNRVGTEAPWNIEFFRDRRPESYGALAEPR